MYIELNLTPEEAAHKIANLKRDERVVRKSVDARKRGNIRVLLQIAKGESIDMEGGFEPRDVNNSESVVVVGAGPAGLFAALGLIEKGFRPVIFERGKSVSDRKRDVASANRGQGIDPESNYAFGEGGAGTFSDGKLYTRSKKRGDNNRILKILHQYGAQEEILYEAHPHIGSDILPRVIENIRSAIIECGGEVHFSSKVTALIIEDNKVKGVEVDGSKRVECGAVILATGHSARDVYGFLHSGGVRLEAKNFAVGVRVEHRQELIDRIQYKDERGEYLPAAAYSLVAQVGGRGVYSFCMCPGGVIVPASTQNGEGVVNGMSNSQRNGVYANSGIVTEVRVEDIEDYTKHFGVLGGLEFQRQLETMACMQGGGSAGVAPAQRLADFVAGRSSRNLPETTYNPGIAPSDLHYWMPRFVGDALRGGFKAFDKKMKGFLTNDAVVIGVESRTSSPVRIPRDRETLQHVEVEGLYPAGEGAGYAGGILSSAVDGIRCAYKIAQR
ncbi:MAG: FAD-dependent oxidoreductase [Rikenellaceae bacterium]